MGRYGRKHHEIEEETGGDAAELNLTPYLDIMMNLVIFLIFSFQVIIEFRLIDVVPPAVGASSSSAGPQEEPKPTITLVITKEGYRLLSSATDVMPAVEIPLVGGEYDHEELHDKLVDWKRDFGLGESIVFTADLDTEYMVVVAAMDAVRSDGDDLLFPDVLLARAGGVN